MRDSGARSRLDACDVVMLLEVWGEWELASEAQVYDEDENEDSVRRMQRLPASALPLLRSTLVRVVNAALARAL